MRILVVTNLYPPQYLGGYEVRCAQVAEALQRSGHEVRVLTSVYGFPLTSWGSPPTRSERVCGVRVDRCLNQYFASPQHRLRPWTLFLAKRELTDARFFIKSVSEFKPDIVNWWNMNGLSKTMLPIPGFLGIPDIHWIEYPWMIDEYGLAGEKAACFWIDFWDGTWGPRVFRPVLKLIGKRWERRIGRESIPTRNFPNRPRHVCFVSEYLRTLYREAGLEFPSSEIIYGGVPIDPFYAPVGSRLQEDGQLRILYAGQITPERGLHTAIEAIGHMDSSDRMRLTLTIAGNNQGNYFQGIQSRVEELKLSQIVTFLGKVPHEEMPAVYKRHHVLLFLSTREEGLPLVMVEAMLAGCAVITTGSGGAIEVAKLADLPLVPKADSLQLSRTLTQFVTHPSQIFEIASRGQQVALQKFSLNRMMERWEATLNRIHQAET
jgi:glycosyltransferase involved in cell wall biosynthesis